MTLCRRWRVEADVAEARGQRRPRVRIVRRPLRDQVVVVTGATSGIGLAIARKAATGGARVLLVARNAAVLQRVAEELTASGATAAWCVADVGVRADVEAAAAAALERFDRIDTWVSNAGVALYSDLLQTPRDEHERLFKTNYWGTVNSPEVATPLMARGGGGALIVVGSIASDMGAPVMGAYAASKHAVKGYVDSLRIELLRDRTPVCVTLIKPAGVDTPLDTHLANHKPGRPKIPPPAYAPELVASAVVRAALRPVREVIVGGAGACQVMAATHVPSLFDRLAGGVTVLLNDPRAPSQAASNLFESQSTGAVRGRSAGRRFSTYTTIRSHPVLALAATAGLLAMAMRKRS